MLSKRERESSGRERLRRIIETCKSVEERSIDPFVVDVKESINTIKEFFPEWNVPEDLCLDAETVHGIASLVRLQSEWVKHRSTTLYTDPFLLEEKLRTLPEEDIVGIFMQAWHPAIELEQISLHSLQEASRYWDSLLPMDERWKESLPNQVEAGTATREELIKQRILQDKAFSEELENHWQKLRIEIKERGRNEKMRYWDFVGADTYEETVQKAFMASFLITYGYATLEIHPLEEETFIKAFERPSTGMNRKQLVSIPIAVTKEEWLRWKRGETR